jgi:ferritin
MISSKMEGLLNRQIELEAAASQFYLAMASWAEVQGYNGVSAWFYTHSHEERQHMLKLIRFVNERGGTAQIAALTSPPNSFSGIAEVFEALLQHEVKVTQEINNLVEFCLAEKDYTTHNFLQWYVAEQIEEERVARQMLDKLKLIGNDKGGMYLFDRDLEALAAKPEAE